MLVAYAWMHCRASTARLQMRDTSNMDSVKCLVDIM